MVKEYRFRIAYGEEAETCIRDIYDGEEYRKHFEAGGFLSQPTNFSFSFNTDGVSIFRSSSKGELWPVYLVFNELPPEKRYINYNQTKSLRFLQILY